jgi:AcrR family transcriptional regulator
LTRRQEKVITYHMMAKVLKNPVETRASYHHGNLRLVLMDAARQEIAAHGASNLSIAALARRAGVAQSAPYRHFGDRDALLEAVATGAFEQFTAILVAAAQAGDKRGAIMRMAAAYLRFGEENVELYRLMFASRLVPASGADSPLAEAADASFRPLLERVIARSKAATRESAVVRWAQLHGLVMLKADGFIKVPLEEFLGELAM